MFFVLLTILGLLGLFIMGWGIYNIGDYERKSGIIKILCGIITSGLALAMSYYWLHSTSLFAVFEWVFFVILGIGGILTAIWGILIFMLGHSANDKKIGLGHFLKGIIAIGLAFAIGSFGLHLAWLKFSLRLWNPFIILPSVTMASGILLGFFANLIEHSLFAAGSAIDTTAEWRFVGSNAKYRDATVRDVYDHKHGIGSWNRETKRAASFWRIIFSFVAAFWFFGVIIHTDIKENFPDLIRIINEINVMPLPELILLLAILFAMSGFIQFVYATFSKHKR